MRQRAVSIEDIARMAEVSPSTVSRALRDSPLISADVRARIQQLAREVGYTPNSIARSLQARRSNTIGLVVTSIADPFWADVLHGVELAARPAGLSVLLSAAHRDPEQEMLAIELFHQRRVDGILVADSHIGGEYAGRLARVQAPAVLINSQADGQHDLLHSVAVDDYGGARQAVAYLLDLGHQRIGYLGSGSRPRSNRRRREGFRDALAAAGLPADDALVAVTPAGPTESEEDVAGGQALLPRVLAAGATAVLCYNDLFAVGALLACRERGLAVPADLSVVGFDDLHLARYVTPPLTTIRQPKVDLGQQAMQLLLALLNNESVQDLVVTPSLVTRASTARLEGRNECASTTRPISSCIPVTQTTPA
ncbi:MAG: LacI family DNA-binding transcriptional regulator [Thermomicrobiales bacterium]